MSAPAQSSLSRTGRQRHAKDHVTLNSNPTPFWQHTVLATQINQPEPAHDFSLIGFGPSITRYGPVTPGMRIDPVHLWPDCSLLSSPRSAPDQALARQMAMDQTHVGLGMSLQRARAAFGSDSSTIAHACHKTKVCRDDDATYALLELLESSLAQVPSPDPCFLARQGFSQSLKDAA